MQNEKTTVPLSALTHEAIPLDRNLVIEVADKIKYNISEDDKNIFMSIGEIAGVIDLNSTFQRATINRVFRNMLFMFRSVNKVNITDVSLYVIDDGDDDDWLMVLDDYVIPFFRTNNVFAVVGNIMLHTAQFDI